MTRISQFRVPLDPFRPAAVAVSTILLVLLSTMEACEKGILGDVDIEFLHDFRVAVRRTRAALGELKGLFPRKRIEKFRTEFTWLGAATGPARDMDVYLADFPRYCRKLPASAGRNLQPLKDFMVERREAEYKKLVRKLRSKRYHRLKESWGQFLRNPRLSVAAPADGRRPIRKVADGRIWKAYRKTLNEGGAIVDGSPPEALHELRITCKKLRYLLEFFESLYPRNEVRELIKSLKRLQENLGEYQDLHVQSEALGEFAARMKKKAAPPSTFVAMDMLAERKKKREVRVRRDFNGRFGAFAGKRNCRLFRKLFHEGAKSRDAG